MGVDSRGSEHNGGMTRSRRATEKARLRASLRTTRAAFDPTERQDQSDALGEAVVAHVGRLFADSAGATPRPTVAAYLGVDPEPRTASLLGELHRLGFGVVVPICEPAYELSWAAWTPGIALERSVRAPVDEPVGPRRRFGDLAPQVALILVPALGVDVEGNRIGQGGGYFDRFLARHPVDEPGAVPRLGVVYRSEILPSGVIPTEPYDQPLTGAFTADGLLRFDRTRDAR